MGLELRMPASHVCVEAHVGETTFSGQAGAQLFGWCRSQSCGAQSLGSGQQHGACGPARTSLSSAPHAPRESGGRTPPRLRPPCLAASVRFLRPNLPSPATHQKHGARGGSRACQSHAGELPHQTPRARFALLPFFVPPLRVSSATFPGQRGVPRVDLHNNAPERPPPAHTSHRPTCLPRSPTATAPERLPLSPRVDKLANSR